MTPRRILIIQLARLGDVVQTWPLVRQVRQAYPQAHLALLSDRAWSGLANLGPELDELHTLEVQGLAQLAGREPKAAYHAITLTLEELGKENFDLIYNLNYSRISLILSYLLKASVTGYRPILGGREFWREPWLALMYGLVHARRFNRLHLSDVFRHLAPSAPIEAPAGVAPPFLGRPTIALQLATRHAKRSWPLANYARLTRLLIEAWDAEIRLLGTAEERALGEEVRQSLPRSCRERVINLQGQTSLKELAEILRTVHLVVSGDTGTLHLAAALGARVMGIFLGPASCFETGPYGEKHTVIQAEPVCHPCAEAGSDCPEPVCREMITPELVAQVVSVVWGINSRPGRVPEGVRIYQSCRDELGISYHIRAGAPPGWADLVGWAYRMAGARLLGPVSRSAPLEGSSLTDTDFQNLQHTSAALRNGAAPPGNPAVQQALTPLRVLGEILERQAAWQGGGQSDLEQFHGMKVALGEELERLAAQARLKT